MAKETKFRGRDEQAVPPIHTEHEPLVNRLLVEFPERTRAEVSAAFQTCRAEMAPSVELDDVARCARERLQAKSEDRKPKPTPPKHAQPLTTPQKRGPSHAP